MTVLPGPPYLDESSSKVRSPGWHHLPSTAMLFANILLTGIFVAVLIVDIHTPWALFIGLLAFVVAAALFVTSILDLLRYSKPVAAIVNLVLSVLINPCMVMAYLVGFRVLDFG